MKTFSLLRMVLFVLLAVRTANALAFDPRTGPVYSAPPARGFLGLPVPQQWSNARPAAGGIVTNMPVRNAAPGNGVNRPSGRPPVCPNGNCYLPAASGGSANCANGQCSFSASGSAYCPDGRCSTGACLNGQCSPQNCLNGTCPNSANLWTPVSHRQEWTPRAGSRYPDSVSGWSDDLQRRENPQRRDDLLRRDELPRRDDRTRYDDWSPRTLRPALDPLNDARGNGYREEDLRLRDDYFYSDPSARTIR